MVSRALLAVLCIAAFGVGCYISPFILPLDILSRILKPEAKKAKPLRTTETPAPSALPTKTWPEKKQGDRKPFKQERAYKNIVGFQGDQDDPFRGVDIHIHRNGEADPCSRQAHYHEDQDGDAGLSPTSKALLYAAERFAVDRPLDKFTKYDFDALLTHALAVGNGNKMISEMLKMCDMGPGRTVIQLDHEKLVRIPTVQSYPCHFHTREGLRVTSLKQLATIAREEAKFPAGECTEADQTAGTCDNGATSERRELHLYAVPASRVFIFAPKYVGEIFELPHVSVPENLPVWLEVISLEPRVFDVFNFFDRDESAAIVDKALKETSESHRIKRSSTGASGYNVNSQRTSENGFDTHGKVSQAVKRRCMNVLGFDEYEESLTDGLQVLRYNKTTAYIPHLDWIDDYGKKQEHNFDSAGLGSNRFATILLYMSDLGVGDGGETVFTSGWPVGQAEEDHVQTNEAIDALRESGDVENILTRDSWEEKMVANCRSRLAVRPHSSRAVLFYSQNPDGTPDRSSKHGGCPVINGEKWAANLWVWNAPRGGFPGSPKNQHVVEKNRSQGKVAENVGQKKASFINSKKDPAMKRAKLLFQDTFWGQLGWGDPPLNVNTFHGHQVSTGVNVSATNNELIVNFNSGMCKLMVKL
ncbi:hypothetical protein THAOC_13503 [Thalassiosira oceanica]|uniref:Fe2OG dioxygenase domain-containing protein n=1 Tax=Thalassiosira oceanica TaxID=159749 RepID=K0SHI1_THAOC|nr:hypothetical protein THAOC_13503 [Thalassiosira oceanica]|eukprot:EJK65613.1 hypothetical protein THAOC_13503 [Thalassiosira oceanica]